MRITGISRSACAALALFLAQLAAPAALAALPVLRIEVVGARTRPEAVLALIDTRAGREFDERVWAEDLRRLRNSELFYLVEGEVAAESGGVALRLLLRNKFGTIPILKYKAGGGSSLITAGVYEVNLARRLLELGGQYEGMNGRHGGVVWFRHPALFSRRNRLGTELYLHAVDLPLLTSRGNPEAFFVNEEARANLWLRRDLGAAGRATLQASVYRNRFRAEDDLAGRPEMNAAFLERHALNDGTTVSVTPRLSLGEIEREGFAIRGSELEVEAEISLAAIGSDFEFVRGVVSWIGAARPHTDWNVAAQVRVGSKTGSEFQHKFYLGGLDTARGFQDGQFRGDHMWLANLEVRPTLVERTLWALQGNLFADLSKTWDARNFGLEGFENPVISVGTGLRVILPRIYRGVLRMDLAWTREPVRQFGLNIGVQQFF